MKNLAHIWPTIAAMAEALGLPYQTVAAWPRRGIPHRRFPQIIAAANRAGHALSWDDLLACAGGDAAHEAIKNEDAA